MSNNLSDGSGVSSLKRRNYSVMAVVCLIYCSVAAGAFGVEEIVCSCGPGMTIMVLVGMAIFWAYPVCLGTAEIASLMPGEGGYYYWTKHTLGEFWAYIAGVSLAISYYTASSTYIVLSANYLTSVIPMTNAEATLIKLGIIIIFTILNLMGLKDVSVVSSIFAVLITLLFAVITVVGLGNWNYNPVDPFLPEGSTVLEGISLGIGFGIWMYCGWGAVTPLAGEIENPQVMSRAMKLAVPLCAITYILPTLAGLASVGHWDMWTTEGGDGIGFNTVLSNAFGEVGLIAFVVIAIVSNLSIFNTNMAGGSRCFFVMADDSLFPKKWITNVSKKRGVPYVGVITISLVTILMMELDFTALVLIQVIPVLIGQFLMAPVIIRTRKGISMETRKKEGCYWVGAGKFGFYTILILPPLICVLAMYLNGMDYFFYSLLFIAVLVVFYPPIKKRLGGLSNVNPANYPINEKTKLAYGDIFRIAKLLFWTGVMGIAGFGLFQLIEGSWGPEYYMEEYGSGLLANFDGTRLAILITGIVFVVVALLLKLWGNKVDKHIIQPVEMDFNIGKLTDQ